MTRWLGILLTLLLALAPLAAAQEDAPEEEYTFEDLVHDDPAAALQQNPVEAFELLGPDSAAWTPEQRDAVASYFRGASAAQFDQVKDSAKAYFETAGNFKGTEGENYVKYLSGGSVHMLLDGNQFIGDVHIKDGIIAKGSVNFVLAGASAGTIVEPVSNGLKITVPGFESTPLTLPAGHDMTLSPRPGGSSFDMAIAGITTQFIVSPDTVKSVSADAGSVTLELHAGQTMRIFKDTARLVDASGGAVGVLGAKDAATVVELKHRGNDWDKITIDKDSLVTVRGDAKGVQIDGAFEMLTRTPAGNALKARLSTDERGRDGRLTVYIGTGDPVSAHASLIQVRTGAIGAGQMPMELTGRAELSFNRADGGVVTITGNVYTAKHGTDESGTMRLLRGPTQRAVMEEAARKAADERKRYDAARKILDEETARAKAQLIPDLKREIAEAKQKRDSGEMPKEEFKLFEKMTNERIKAIEKSLDRQDDALDKWRDSLPTPIRRGEYVFTAQEIVDSRIPVDLVSETIVKGGSIAGVTLTAPSDIDALSDIKSSVKILSMQGAEAIPFSVQWGSKSITQAVDPSDPTSASVVNERGKKIDVLRGTIAIESSTSTPGAPAQIVLLDSKGNPVVNRMTLTLDTKGAVAALGGEWGEFLAARTKEGRVEMAEVTQGVGGEITLRGSIAALDPYMGRAFFFWSVSNLVQQGLATELQSVGESTLAAARSQIDAMLPAAGSSPTLSLIPDAIASSMQRITSLESEQLTDAMRMKKLTDLEITIHPAVSGGSVPDSLRSARTAATTVTSMLAEAMPRDQFMALRTMPTDEAIAAIKPRVDAMEHFWAGNIRETALKTIGESMPSVSVSFGGLDKRGQPVTLESGAVKIEPTPEQLETLYEEVFLRQIVEYAREYNPVTQRYMNEPLKADAQLYKSNPDAFAKTGDAVSMQFSLTMLRIQRATAIESMYRDSVGLPAK